MTDSSSELKSVPCDMCGSDESELFLRVSRIKGDENRDLVRCKNCGLLYVSPRKIQKYEDLSEDSYLDGMEDLDAIKDMKAFKHFYDIISLWKDPPGRFLDVGCGAGYLLDVARANGWSTVGVDPWKSLVHVGKRYLKLDIREGTLFDWHFEGGSFDVVAMTELIEHVPSPSKVLREVYRILMDDGILFLTAPNIESSSFKKLGENWVPAIEPLGHLYYFSSASIQKMLGREGFEIRDIFVDGGKEHDEILYVVAARGKCGEADKKIQAAQLARLHASYYNRLIHHWFFGPFMRMGDHLINYPPEAKKQRRQGVNEKRYGRLESHWFFGPIVKLGNYLVNRNKEISIWNK